MDGIAMATSNGTRRVALIQMSCDPDTKINLEKAAERVYEAARQGAALVCLPELFRAQYFCQREDHELFGLAESIPGPSTDALTQVCREARVVLVASLFERRAPGLYHNTAVTIEKDGSIADVYRKMHIPDDPLYYEKFYFTPGDHTPNSGIEFWGGSFIADPFGRILAQASHDKEEILIADLDPKLIEVTRQHWPFLRDRRIDAYEGIAKRFLD